MKGKDRKRIVKNLSVFLWQLSIWAFFYFYDHILFPLFRCISSYNLGRLVWKKFIEWVKSQAKSQPLCPRVDGEFKKIFEHKSNVGKVVLFVEDETMETLEAESTVLIF